MSIDFDGTNDGLDVTLFGVDLDLFFWTISLNYDTAAGVRPAIYMSDSGDANSYLVLAKRNTGAIWDLTAHFGTGGSEASVVVSNTLSVSTWWRIQFYVGMNAGTLGIGLRSSTDGTAGSFTTNSSAGFTGWTVDTCKFGYGNGQFLNGRLAEANIIRDSPTVGVPARFADILMRDYSPMSLMAPIFEEEGELGLYWPMYTASHLSDVFTKTALSLVDAPATHASHPRILRSGGKKVTIN